MRERSVVFVAFQLTKGTPEDVIMGTCLLISHTSYGSLGFKDTLAKSLSFKLRHVGEYLYLT